MVTDRRRDYDHALGKGKYLHLIHDPPFDPAEYRIGVDPGLDRHAFLAWQRDAPNAFSQMEADNELLKKLKDKEKLSILIIGVLCLLFVPVFKTVTHLPRLWVS